MVYSEKNASQVKSLLQKEIFSFDGNSNGGLEKITLRKVGDDDVDVKLGATSDIGDKEQNVKEKEWKWHLVETRYLIFKPYRLSK